MGAPAAGLVSSKSLWFLHGLGIGRMESNDSPAVLVSRLSPLSVRVGAEGVSPNDVWLLTPGRGYRGRDTARLRRNASHAGELLEVRRADRALRRHRVV